MASSGRHKQPKSKPASQQHTCKQKGGGPPSKSSGLGCTTLWQTPEFRDRKTNTIIRQENQIVIIRHACAFGGDVSLGPRAESQKAQCQLLQAQTQNIRGQDKTSPSQWIDRFHWHPVSLPHPLQSWSLHNIPRHWGHTNNQVSCQIRHRCRTPCSTQRYQT